MDFDEVKKEHIIQAIKDFEQKGYPNGLSDSKYYDVEIQGQLYPPKPIMAYANMHASGKEPGNYFSGGKDTPCWQAFERIGVTILKKTNSIKDQSIKELIDNYKNLIRSNGLEDEKYKWELIRDSKGLPSLEKNLEQELSKIKFNNILYQLAVPCIKGIAREFEKELKVEFHALFDNSIDLNTRVSKFNKNTLKLYRKAKGENSHHQDERSIAAYLTLQNPAKYTFYKSTYYTEYCKLINEKSAKAKEKYSHYLELIKDLAENYISKDNELIDIVHKELNELVVADPNYLLVAQDMLYQLLDAQRGKNYWIFQGNPKVFDFKTALRDKILTDWTVSAHKDKIKVGDKVILWITGDKSGCYALAEITSNPQKKTNASDDHLWKEEDTGELKAGIKITHNLVDSPILKNDIKGAKELEELNVGHQGTNFNATKSQYSAILDMIKTNNSLPNEHQLLIDRIQLLGFEETNEFYNQLDKIKFDFSLKQNDQRLCYSLDNKSKIVLTVIDRYSIGADVTKDNIEFMYMDYTDGNKDWIKYTNTFSEIDFTYRFLKDAIKEELKKDRPTRFSKHSSEAFEKSVHDAGYRNQIFKLAFAKEFKTRKKRRFWLYAPGEDAYKWEEFYKKGCMGLNYDELGDLNQYDSQIEIEKKISEYNLSDSAPINHSKANYQFCNELEIGDFVIVKKGRQEYLGYGIVESDYSFDNTLDSFKSQRKVKWIKKGTWKSEHNTALKTLTDITDVNYKPNPELKAYEGIYKIINADHMGVKTNKESRNTILFGPPGTGKTYKLKTEYFPEYTTKETSLSADENFERVVSDLTWFEAMALAMLENNAPISVPELKENLWIVTKAKYSKTKNINAGLWGQLQAHTIDNCEFVNSKNRQSPQIFKKNEDKSWEISMDDFEDLIPELSNVLEKTNNFQANPNKEIKRYEFVTFHQSYAYEDFIEGIKPVMETEGDGELRYEIKDGLFKTLCQRAKNDPENKYAIFIDEINRGNVSSIFGELITLIEPDKRLGMENAMTATLPYSRDAFGVPSNVDIYGTMNTADRSVEALDTALRRRFAFEEMLPKPELLKQAIKKGVSLEDILVCINERIEALIDRDHTIGHSYLFNAKSMDDLKLAFKDKIIPLLQEYFYGDYGKIGLVLGEGFVKMHPQDNEIFADFEYDGSDGLAQNKFELITINEAFDMEEAIETLLNNSGE